MPLKLELAQYAILIMSIVLHEISHGWSALALGDDTAKRSGRLTLNPIPHLDPFGSVILPGLLIATHAGFVFGWARPVPVNVSRLRHPRNDAVWTSLAGPAMNLVLMGVALFALRVFHPQSYWPVNLLFLLGFLNILLAMFNLIPVPPLDGSAVVERLLPRSWYGPYLAIRPYTMVLVIVLVMVVQRTAYWDDAVNYVYLHWLSATGYGL